MIEVGLYALLSTTSAITSILGSRQGSDTGIYPVELPEGAQLPALVYKIIYGGGVPTFNTSGMQRWRIQFDCYGQDYLDSITLRAALVKFFNGYQGLLSDGTLLQNAEYLGPLDDFEQVPRQFRCAVEFYILFDFSS